VNDQSFQGLPVLCLFPGSAAERAGVKTGDRVLIANGQRIDSLDGYIAARAVYSDRLEITVQRGNEILDMVLVFDRPDGSATESAAA
jgi:S1-C subfamily serine protease